MTQPTLGRQISALEKEQGVALFARRANAQELGPQGVEMVQHVRRMRLVYDFLAQVLSSRA